MPELPHQSTGRPCSTCGREKDCGRAECSACRSRRRRSDPEKRERDLAYSRQWKEANRERNRARDKAYYRAKKGAPNA